MKKLTFLLILSIFSNLLLAQNNQLKVYLEDNLLENNDTLSIHEDELRFNNIMYFKISTDTLIYVEDIELRVNGKIEDISGIVGFRLDYPSRKAGSFSYVLTYPIAVIEILTLKIKNEKYDFTTIIYVKRKEKVKPPPPIVEIVWENPVQANRKEKTGIATSLETYFLHLKIKTSEPIDLEDLKLLHNGSYYKKDDLKSEFKIDAKFIRCGENTYEYEYVKEVALNEGFNDFRLELKYSNLIPEQDRFYSTPLYIMKE